MSRLVMGAFAILVLLAFIQIGSRLTALTPVEKPAAQVLLENKISNSVDEFITSQRDIFKRGSAEALVGR